MGDREHIMLLRSGVERWNEWRARHPDIVPDLSGAAFEDIDLYMRANLAGANLRRANFRGGRLDLATFRGSTVVEANFRHCSLRKTDWRNVDARGAVLANANLHLAILNNADFRGADFSGAGLDVRNAVGANLANARLNDCMYDVHGPMARETLGFAALAHAKGLAEVHQESRKDVLRYIEEVFEVCEEYSTAVNDVKAVPVPEDLYVPYVAEALRNIEVLRHFYDTGPLESATLEGITRVTSSILSLLRSHPERLDRLHWRDFERLMAEILLEHGWEVELTSRTRDGGYDIFGIYTNSLGLRQTWIVECKHPPSGKPVGVDIVRSLYGVKASLGVSGALLATTSYFTQGATAFKASSYDLELKDREAIMTWLESRDALYG